MNMKNIKTYLLLLVFGFFASCDCLQHVQGIVFDAETQLPIDSVMIVAEFKRIMQPHCNPNLLIV